MTEPHDEFDAAIQESWRKSEGGGFVSNWILIVEGVDEDGQRWFDRAWSEGGTSWQRKGMLHEALDMQLTDDVVEAVTEED